MIQIKEETTTSFTENLKSKSIVAYPESFEELNEVLRFAKDNRINYYYNILFQLNYEGKIKNLKSYGFKGIDK